MVCSFPKDVGACKSNIDRWYFDNIKGNCEIFSYSGCDGNANNFRTLEQCHKVCADYQSESLSINPQQNTFRCFSPSPEELIANLTAHKRQLDVTISGVLSYNVQNDAINGNNCGNYLLTAAQSPSDRAPVSAPSYRPYSQIQVVNATDCELTKWSGWGRCNVTGHCGAGYRTKYRQIKVGQGES